jgi:hypothetical protein
MSYINVSAPTSRAELQILAGDTAIASTSTGTIVPALQDITVNNSNGVFNWTQLDATAQKSVATPATNQISGNIVLDSATFFGTGGLFDLSKNKTLVQFRVYFNGRYTGGKYVTGEGYITNLAPSVNPTAPVWVSPIQIAVNGDLDSGTL